MNNQNHLFLIRDEDKGRSDTLVLQGDFLHVRVITDSGLDVGHSYEIAYPLPIDSVERFLDYARGEIVTSGDSEANSILLKLLYMETQAQRKYVRTQHPDYF